MSKSKVCLILSAFIYGFAPILAKFAYKSGANGITLTFLYLPQTASWQAPSFHDSSYAFLLYEFVIETAGHQRSSFPAVISVDQFMIIPGSFSSLPQMCFPSYAPAEYEAALPPPAPLQPDR